MRCIDNRAGVQLCTLEIVIYNNVFTYTAFLNDVLIYLYLIPPVLVRQDCTLLCNDNDTSTRTSTIRSTRVPCWTQDENS